MPKSFSTAIVLVASMSLIACASSAVSSRPASTTAGSVITVAEPTVVFSSDGLAASLERYREDDVPNRIQIQVTSKAGTGVQLGELRLVSPAFGELAPSPLVHLVSPGQRVDLPVQLGPAACSNPPAIDETPPSGESFAVGKMSVDGASPADVRIPITDIRGVVQRLFGPLCNVQAVAYKATVEFGKTWTDTEFEGKPAAAGTLRITRKNSTEAITISEIRGSVLLRFKPEKPPTGTLVSLEAGQQSAEVPVLLVESGDCRPHAIADSKHTFFLPAVITIGGTTTTIIDVMPDEVSQIQLSQMINRSCGLA
jgi:hypothetical protein